MSTKTTNNFHGKREGKNGSRIMRQRTSGVLAPMIFKSAVMHFLAMRLPLADNMNYSETAH